VSPAEQARWQARSILHERRFHDSQLPRPLHGVLGWLGDRLHSVVDALDSVLPGGESVVVLFLAAAVLGLALVVAARLIRGRGPGVGRARSDRRASGLDPDVLDRQAEEAERAGDYELALRLRFRAGTIRLARRSILDDPASVTTGGLVRRLPSEAFAAAAQRFDEVVYGRRPPTPDDARLVREGWLAVLGR
jgi:hypothetical protein